MAVGQFEVVSKAAPTPGQSVGKVSFFDENGDPIDIGGGGPVSAEDVSVAADDGIVGANVQAVLADLAARVVAIESA